MLLLEIIIEQVYIVREKVIWKVKKHEVSKQKYYVNIYTLPLELPQNYPVEIENYNPRKCKRLFEHNQGSNRKT